MPRVLLVVLSLLASIANAQTISYFRSPRGLPQKIAAGPDGNLWFTQQAFFALGSGQVDGLTRLTPLGEMTSFPSPHAPIPRNGLVEWPKGSMSFSWSDGVDSFDIATQTYATRLTPVTAQTLLSGPDGNLWFGYYGGIGRMTPYGDVKLFPLALRPGYGVPDILGLTVGSDGNIWFADWRAHGFGTMDLSGNAIKYADCCGAADIATTTGGAVWAMGLSWLGQVNADYTVSTVDSPRPGLILQRLVPGPEGTVWFAATSYTIGMASAAGVKAFTVDYPYPIDLVAGPDGNIWAVLYVVYGCVTPCFIDPTPPVALVRINLVNPAPTITSVDPASDGVVIRGLGFVPDTVIRLNGVDQPTIYRTPFEVELKLPSASRGGTFVAVNKAPGGGASAPFTLVPTNSRHRAVK